MLLPLVIRGNETIINDESVEDTRQPRASGRIVKLYSGARREPIICSSDGFKADPHDCTVFYRCMKSGSGKYTIFRFQCGPGTIYDIDSEVCNHPRSTKRSECGGLNVPSIEENDNGIENYNQEVPKPISTKFPVYFTTSTTVKTSTISLTTPSSKPNTDSLNLDTANEITKFHESVVSTVPMTSTTKYYEHKNNAIVDYSSSSPTKLEAVTASQGLKSQSNICISEGFHSENCHKFYRCVGNQRGGFMKFEFSCSAFTVWDDEIQACNHPWAVKRSRCSRSSSDSSSVQIKPAIKDSHIGTMQTTTSSFTENGTINSSQVIHAPHLSQAPVKINDDELKQNANNKIEQNHSHINYGEVESHIPTKIYKDIALFQNQTDKFKQPSQKEEVNKTGTNVPTAQTESNPKINNLCVQTGFLGDPYDCKKFYRCVDTGKGNFIKYEFSCGESTVWDPKLEACNHAWAVPKCGGNFMSTTEVDVVESALNASNSFTPSAPVIQTTIEIDAEEEDIGYGNIHSSVKTTTPRTTTIDSSPQISPLNDCKSSGFKGDSKDCSIFYRCVEDANGRYTKYEFKCGEGTVWDSNLEACNHAWAVKKCGENELSIENISTTTETTTISKNPTSPSQTIMNSKNPITTLNGNLTTTTTTEIYQPDQEDSGYIGHIEEITSSTTKLPDSSINGSSECKSNGFLGDKNNCKIFYRCVSNGDGSFNKYEFTCGEGTVWDSKIEACNHAWAVESCGGISVSSSSEIFDLVSTISPQLTTTNKAENSNIESTGDTATTTLVLVSFSTTTTETVALTTNTCKSTGFIGDQKDCKKFYRCVDNGDGTFTRFEFNCGEGTVWDSKIGNCNHAWAVEKCGEYGEDENSNAANTSDGKPIFADEYDNGVATTSKTTNNEKPDFIQTTVLSPIVNTICKQSGFIVDKNDCQKFYRCVDDGKGGFIQFDYRCGEGTVWDSSIEACNHVWAAQECRFDNVTSETIDSSTHESPPTSSVQESLNSTLPSVINTVATSTEKAVSDYCTQDGFIGDKRDCKTFYRCVHNSHGDFIKYEFRCGEGTFWNQEIQACDHVSENKRCYSPDHEIVDTRPQIENDEIYTEAMTEIISTSHSPIVTQKPVISEDTCQNEGFFGDSSDCQKFYRCVEDSKNGYTKYEFVCGAGTIWNQDIIACDHPTSENKCLGENINSNPNQTNESNVDGESSDITSTLKPHSTREPENSTSADTDECISEGFYANSHDCKKFFRCVINDKGTFTKYDFICGIGTIWVQEIQACDHNNGIETCTSINIPETSTVTYASTTSQSSSNTTPLLSTPIKNDNDYYTSTKKPNTEVCEAEGFFGNDNDCKKFYRCVDNGQGGYTKHEFSCGEGTAWDTTIESCNHIDNVKNCHFSHQDESQTQPILFDEMPSTENEQGTTRVPSSSQSTESSISDDKANCESEGYFGDTEDCKIFYRCVDNGKNGFTKYEFTCGEGTIWDQDLTTCNHPQDVLKPSCGHTSEQISTSSTMSSSSSDSPSATSTLSTTASTTEISNSTSNNASQESSNKPNQNITCPKEGFYPNPNDCKKFYRCVDWDSNGQRFSVYHFECADGTIWDPALNTCNHEESVYPPRDCSNTQSESQITGQETTTEEQLQESSTQTTSEMTTATNEEAATQQTSTTQKTTTTEETTMSEEPTTRQTTTLDTSTIHSTTQQHSTEEISTSQTHAQSTTQQATTQTQTSTQITVQQTTTSEPSTTQQQTSSQTTTDQTMENSTSDQTTSTTNTATTQPTTSEYSSTEISTTSETAITEQSTNQATNSTQMTTTLTDVSTTTDPTLSTTTETASITEVSQELTTTEENSSTTSEGPTEASTQEIGTESSTTNMETSTEGNTDGNCPNTEDDQHLFVCPTSFRRHPKYCNIFYQCTEDDETHEIKIATFNCPNNTIYDESQTKCVEQDKTNIECDGEISSRRRLKHLSLHYKDPIIVTRDSQSCSSEGHMPFEKNSECSPAFLKCEKSKNGRLRGIVHQCPQNYVYWSISRRCERVERVRDCKRTTNNWNGRWEIPIDRHNVAW